MSSPELKVTIATKNKAVTQEARQRVLSIVLGALSKDGDAKQAITELVMETDFFVEFKDPNRRRILTLDEAGAR